MKKYLKIWWMLTIASIQNSFLSRFGAGILISGKLIRFLLFFFFLFILGSQISKIGGYTLNQMIVFYLTFQLVDTIPQFLMRSVYTFRQHIVTGDFDYFLISPFSALFRALFGSTDPLDIPMILILITFLGIFITKAFNINIFNIFLYIIFIFNALIIAISFHIAVLALGIVTTEIDNAIMLYRDTTQMGRFPIDIYKEPLRSFITFVIPVGIMMSVPARALLGLLSFNLIIASFLIAIIFLILSLIFWKYSLALYGSASS